VTVSCEEADELTKFDIEYEKSFTVPATLGIDTPLSIPTPDITTNYEEKLSGNDTKKDLVEKIYMKELILTIQSPSGEDFSFLKNLTIYINAEGMEETEIATRESISDDVGSKIKMETSKTDLKEYIFKDTFNLKVKVTTDETFTQNHEINAAMVFTVDAKLL
jgi:hypothetical protein